MYSAVNLTIKGICHLLCRLDVAQLGRVPERGPLIIVSNHINFLEIPVVYTHLIPRPVTGFAKAETWDNPILGYLFTLWGAIPLRRGEVDLVALRRALAELEAGKIVAVAPEGTRSGHGRLQRGHPGVVWLALRSRAPLLPLVYYGGEEFRNKISRLKRTDFRVEVGRAFYLDAGAEKVTQEVREQMTDEIMYQLAALLPPANRGVYANRDLATETYLRFLPEEGRDL